MKKKILVVNNQMELGGVCIAAKNFIENMKGDYDIEFVLAKKQGELNNRLPKDINVSYMPYPINLSTKMRRDVKGLSFMAKVRLFLAHGIKKLTNASFATKFLLKRSIKNKTKYDMLINNDMDMTRKGFGACHAYSKHLAQAKVKCLVIHGDFVANGYDQEFFKKEYLPSYDYIITLTEFECERMKGIYPNYASKFVTIPNFEANEEIKELSTKKEIEFDNSVLNIVSVSRLTEVKGFFRSLAVFKKLKEEGYKFCWHILGDGEQRDEILAFLEQNAMKDCVKLHGMQNNPYPYMKGADLLYLGSFHESYGLVLIEALIVGTPVVSTETIATAEIVDENYGWICENSESGIYNCLKTILGDKELLAPKKENLINYVFDNDSIKQKYEELLRK